MPLKSDRSVRAFLADRLGAVTIMAPFVTMAIIGLAAIAVDGSNFYLARRHLQGMTDLAALAAAGNLAHVTRGATASLTANTVPLSQLESVETGTYSADPNIPIGSRFTPGTGEGVNAVRVTLSSTVRGPFASALSFLSFPVRTRAIAANTAVAAVAINPPLLGLDPVIANGILGGLIGTSVNLSTANYLELGSLTVDMFAFANRVAERSGVTGSYLDLMKTSVRLGDVFYALAEVLSNTGAPQTACSAVRALAVATSFGGRRITFGNLIAFEAYGQRAVGLDGPTGAPVPVLPMITTAVRLALAATGNQVSHISTAVPSSRLGVKVSVATNLPKDGFSYAAIGPVGTTLRTLQTRALIRLQLPYSGSFASPNLSFYMQSQAATVRIVSISRTVDRGDSVTVGVVPGLSTIWIGSVPDQSLSNWSVDPHPSHAPIADVKSFKLSASAELSGGSNSETLMTFDAADIAACRMKVLNGDSFLIPFLSLIKSINYRFDARGHGFSTKAAVVAAATQMLQQHSAVTASTVDQTLNLLGFNHGNTGVWGCAVRVGRVSLMS